MILLVQRRMDASGYNQSEDSVKVMDNQLQHIARFDYKCWLKTTGTELKMNELQIFKLQKVEV